MTKKMPPHVKGLLILFFIATVLTLGLAPALTAATLTAYDTLAAGPIDASKWSKYEFIRVIEAVNSSSHVLRLGIRSAGASTGPVISSLGFKDPSAVSKISASVIPVKIFTSNGGSGAYAKGMAVVGGRFYSSLVTPTPGDCTGDVLGQVGVATAGTNATAGVLHWSVVKYTSADCSTMDTLGSGVLTSTAVVTDTAYPVSIEWNGTDREFTFKATKDGTTYTHIFQDITSTAVSAPGTSFKGLYTRIKDNVKNDVGLNAMITAQFDAVCWNDGADHCDDFSSGAIDPDIWANPEFVRAIKDSEAHLILLAKSTTSSTTYTESNLPIVSPESIGTIQATVTPVDLSLTPNVTGTANAIVYVGGRFFNDGTGGAGVYEGDIAAFIKLQVADDGQNYVGKWKVTRFTGDTVPEQETIAQGEAGKAVVLGKPYKLSVSWDGSKFTFVGNKQTVNYTPPITVTANATDAKMPYKGLGAYISEGEVTATARGYFTDVMIGSAPEFVAVDISGTGSVKSSPTGIACGNGGTYCSKAFPAGKKITLNAKAGTDWVFEKWVNVSGTSCSTKTSCQITMDGAKEVRANFIKQPTISVSPAGKKSFPKVKAGTTKPATATFTITDKTTKGVAALTVSSISLNITTGDPSDFQLQGDSACTSAPIASKGKCTFKVLFQPAHTGDKAATLTINSDDPASPSTVINLTGTGT